MKLIFTLLLLSNIALATNINCSVKINYELVDKVSIDLNQSNKALITEMDGMAFYLLKAKDTYTIEFYNQDASSRMYASGAINQNNGINFVSWKREAIIEVNCQMWRFVHIYLKST